MSASRASALKPISARVPAPVFRLVRRGLEARRLVFHQRRADDSGLQQQSKRGPATADQASVRGDNDEKNSPIRANGWNAAVSFRAGSASMAANTSASRRADGAPRLSLSRMVSAYSSWITAYCRARSGSRASASSTTGGVTGAQRSGRMPGQQRLDIAGFAIREILIANLALHHGPTSLHAGCFEQLGQFLARIEQTRLHRIFRNPDDLPRPPPRISRGSRPDRRSPGGPAKGRSGTFATLTGVLFRDRDFRIIGRVLDRGRLSRRPNSASFLLRRADRALNLVIASSHVETADRPSNFPACRQTSRKTSLMRSSATCSFLHEP